MALRSPQQAADRTPEEELVRYYRQKSVGVPRGVEHTVSRAFAHAHSRTDARSRALAHAHSLTQQRTRARTHAYEHTSILCITFVYLIS